MQLILPISHPPPALTRHLASRGLVPMKVPSWKCRESKIQHQTCLCIELWNIPLLPSQKHINLWKDRKKGLTSRQWGDCSLSPSVQQQKQHDQTVHNPDSGKRICPSTTRICLFSHQQGLEWGKSSTQPKAVFALMLSRPSSLTSVVIALSLKADLKLKESRVYKRKFFLRATGEERWLVLGQEVTDKYPGKCPCFGTLP